MLKNTNIENSLKCFKFGHNESLLVNLSCEPEGWNVVSPVFHAVLVTSRPVYESYVYSDADSNYETCVHGYRYM